MKRKIVNPNPEQKKLLKTEEKIYKTELEQELKLEQEVSKKEKEHNKVHKIERS